MSHFSYPKGDLQCQSVRLLVSGCAERPFVSAWLASGEAQKAAPDFLGGGKGDSVLPEREKRKVLICSATRWVRGERRSG